MGKAHSYSPSCVFQCLNVGDVYGDLGARLDVGDVLGEDIGALLVEKAGDVALLLGVS